MQDHEPHLTRSDWLLIVSVLLLVISVLLWSLLWDPQPPTPPP
jgi:hypothetical protein